MTEPTQAILLNNNLNDMKQTLLTRGIVSRYLISILAIGLVAGSVLHSGVIRDQPAQVKDMDARYFYAAAKCWASSQSPYDATAFSSRFHAEFATEPDTSLAYPPTLMLLVLPMGYFKWSVAAKLFSILNFGAAMVLFWSCYRLVRESLGAPLRIVHWFWVVLASTMAAIDVSIFYGQSSVFIAAACAIALVGSRLQRPWLAVIGLVIATAKPQLSLPLLIFMPLFERRQRKAFLIAAAVIALPCAYAASIDPHIVQSYRDTVYSYGSVQINDPANQIGAVSLLARIGIGSPTSRIIGVICCLAVLFLAARLLLRSRESLSSSPLAMMLVVFSTGLAIPFHSPGMCCYSVGIALIATAKPRYRATYLLPSLFAWRPDLLLDRLHWNMPKSLIPSIAWMALILVTVVMYGGAVRQGKTVLPAERKVLKGLDATDSGYSLG